MKTNEIRKLVKKITGYDYIAVRKGTGSLRGYFNIFSSINDGQSLKAFEKEIRAVFDIEVFSVYAVTIKA